MTPLQPSQPEPAPVAPPTHADVPYGPHQRNVLDFWSAEPSPGGEPPPLIVWIHGGGFRGGDKRSVAVFLDSWRAAGLSVAAIHYRLSQDAPAPAPFLDGARAVQFLRTKAAAWGFDRQRVAASGGSAGAGIALWIGFRGDLADPSSSDPVARQSTRLSCLLVRGAQTSYDTRFIRKHIQGPAYAHPALIQLFRLEEGEAEQPPPEKAHLMEATAPLNFVGPGAPPVYLVYPQQNTPTTPETDANTGIHHPTFGYLLKERLDALGIECVVRCGATPPSLPGYDPSDEVAWLLEHLP